MLCMAENCCCGRPEKNKNPVPQAACFQHKNRSPVTILNQQAGLTELAGKV